MSLIPSSRNPVRPRRRGVLLTAGSALLAAGAALLAGCSGGPRSPAGSGDVGPSAEERARARAARDSEGLAGRYEAVIAAHPRLAGRLEPLRAQVRRHAEALAEGLPTPSASASGAKGASPSASPAGAPGVASSNPSPAASGPSSAAVPADEGDAIAALAAAERELADRRAETLLRLPGEPARLFASVAAAGAAHAYLLTEGQK